MSHVVTVPELDGHTVLDVECLDRSYLNGYVPMLQVMVKFRKGTRKKAQGPAAAREGLQHGGGCDRQQTRLSPLGLASMGARHRILAEVRFDQAHRAVAL